jgi:nucleoside-diphosphate-sugar epimerase
LRIAVTGAGGFIGRCVVSSALRKGHQVSAITRSPSPSLAVDLHQSDVRPADLSSLEGTVRALEGADCIIHLAARMDGTKDGVAETLASTRVLCQAMRQLDIRRLVLVSSIAVLDYERLRPGSVVDESTPTRVDAAPHDLYVQMKLKQEEICREWSEHHPGSRLIVVRPGLVYDEKVLSGSHAGVMAGGLLLASVHNGEVPVIKACELGDFLLEATLFEDSALFLAVGHTLPNQSEYLKALRAKGTVRWIIPLHWRLYSAVAQCASALLPGPLGRFLPSGLRKESVASRMTPFRFSSARSRSRLGWDPPRSSVDCLFGKLAHQPGDQA